MKAAEAMEKLREQAVAKMMPNWKALLEKKLEQWKQYREEVRQKMQDANRRTAVHPQKWTKSLNDIVK